MGINFYQKRALNTAVFESNDYPLIALGEEVGEVMGKIAKFGRKNNLSPNQVKAKSGVTPHHFTNKVFKDSIIIVFVC